MTSERFGAGHERSASSDTGCFAVLVLVATLATILFWLIGTAAEVRGPHERLQPGSRIRRAYSSQFLARLLVQPEQCRTTAADLVGATGPMGGE